MFTFNGQCPHCSAKCSFETFGLSGYAYDALGNEMSSHDVIMHASSSMRFGPAMPVRFSIAGTCCACHRPVVAELSATKEAHIRIMGEATAMHSRMNLSDFDGFLSVVDMWPHPAPPYAHESIPEKVRKAFVSAQVILCDPVIQPHIIITTCRTVLECAVRELGGEGRSLYGMVDDLFRKGVITRSIHEWADILRTAGNDAVHDMDGTRSDAREIVEFTKVFLQFTFEMPYRIARFRDQGRSHCE